MCICVKYDIYVDIAFYIEIRGDREQIHTGCGVVSGGVTIGTSALLLFAVTDAPDSTCTGGADICSPEVMFTNDVVAVVISAGVAVAVALA